MRKWLKRLFLICILNVTLGLLMLCAGCFGAVRNNKDKFSDGSAIHLSYDMETSRLSWDCDPSVDHYFVTIETKDGDVVFSDYVGGNVDGTPNDSFLGDETDKIRRAGEEAVVKIKAMNSNGGDPLWVERVPVKCLYVRTLLLDTEKGTLSWEPVEGVTSYMVMSPIKQEVVETCEIDVRPYLEEGVLKTVSVAPCGDDSAFCISLKTESQAALAPIVEGATYAKGKLEWWVGPIPTALPYSFKDIVYLVTIKDGDEQLVVREGIEEYLYMPQTSGFTCEITTRLQEDLKDAKKFVSPAPCSYTPKCLGGVTEVRCVKGETTFEWDSQSSRQLLWINGEQVEDITANRCNYLDIGKEGVSELKIHPVATEDGAYYIPSTHKVRIAYEPQINIVPTGDDTVHITVNNMEGASAFTLTYSGSKGEEYVVETEEISVTGGEYSFDWTMPAGEYYTRYTFQATPHFTDGIPTRGATKREQLARSKVPEIKGVSFAPPSSCVSFENNNHQVEVDINGSIYSVRWDKNEFYIPEEYLPTDGEESSITIRARAIPMQDYGYPQLSSVWKEYELRFMSTPKDLYIQEGILHWAYEGEYPVLQYQTSTSAKVASTEWKIVRKIAGEASLTVHAIGDNSQSKETGVWYFDSPKSEEVSFRKLAPISNVEDNVYGLTWTADEYGIESVVSFSGALGSNRSFSCDFPEFEFAPYLKEYPSLNVAIYVKGDGVTTIDSENTYLKVTTDPQLKYQVKNDMDIHSDIIHSASWSNLNTEIDDDYELLDPSGGLLDSAKGVLTRETNFVKSELVGDYVLRINAAPGLVARTSETDIYHLKTGDNKYDWTEKIIHKMYAETKIIDGDLHVSTVPLVQGISHYLRLRGSQIHHGPVYESKTGTWVIPGSYFSKWEVGPNQITVDFEMRMEEADERLLFYNQFVAGRYNFEVKVAPTPEIVFGEYAPRKEYYTYDAATKTYVEKAEEGQDGYVYVGVKELLPYAKSYTYSLYDETDAVQQTYTSKDVCKVAIEKESLYHFFFSAKVNVGAFVEESEGWIYYKDSEESAQDMPTVESVKFRTAPVWDSGTFSFTFTGFGNDRLRVYVGGELVTELQPEKLSTSSYRFVYDTGLAAGEQITLCWYRVPQGLDYGSTECYCDFTVE